MRLIFVLAMVGVITFELNAQTYPVKWKDLVGVTDNNGALTKTPVGGGWNAGANSYNVLPAGIDGWVEFTVGDLTSRTIVGFSVLDAEFNYPSTLHSWFAASSAGHFMESGFYVSIITYSIGDILRVSREGNFVKYYQNGVLIRSAGISRSQAWTVKALVEVGSTPAVRCSFDVQMALNRTITPVQPNATGGAIQVAPTGGTSPYTYLWSSGETTSSITNKNKGDYSVAVTDAVGRTKKETYHLTFPTQIIYVKKGATGAGNGSSWANAYPELQPALGAAAAISGHKEIWVSQGEYKPTYTVDRTISFNLPANTFLYGGFLSGETLLEQRNWRENRTVLSGDLGALFNKNDNTYHVVVAMNVDGNTGIDGFIITQGNAVAVTENPSFHKSGGGIVVIGRTAATSPKIRNCEFLNNRAEGFGGGLANISDGNSIATEVTNCFFNGNMSTLGGGVGNYKLTGSNSPVFTNCSFSTNWANLGGAMANQGNEATIINCSMTKNSCDTDGGAILNNSDLIVTIKNSILWENFKGESEGTGANNQIVNYSGTPVVQHNIIQGGYGVAADQNMSEDPLFVRKPSVVGKFPRTSVVPIENTDKKYENTLNFSGPKMPGGWVYWNYFDAPYNKLYLHGKHFQVIDFGNLTNGLPTSTVHYDINFGRIQRPEKSIYTSGNKLFLGTGNGLTGMFSIERATGVVSSTNLIADEPTTFTVCKTQDIVIDNENHLLYAPIFNTLSTFYGLLELNLLTNTKRWITTTSSPVSIPPVNPASDDVAYWNGHRLFHDEVANILYYSIGNGVWWWNRNTNATGVINTEGGIALKPNNPKLPSNLVTSMYIDRADDKFYFGTHAGLFVWDRISKTSKVYNTSNSVFTSNLVNTIDKNSNENLIYVGFELFGGVVTLNSITGEQKSYLKDSHEGTHPTMIDSEIESAFYYEHDNKLYVSSDGPNGGLWIKDYGNLIPDYGDLNLQDGSPAIDRSDATAFPPSVTVDINGLDRFVNYAVLGANSLDLGAYEKTLVCQQLTSDFQSERNVTTYTFTPVLGAGSEGFTVSYHWNFGDGATSTEPNPSHKYSAIGTYAVILKVSYSFGECAPVENTTEHSITIERLCESIFCNDDGSVSIGTPESASGYKLSVQGKIITEGARVALVSRWPDYVFQKDYVLQSLPQLNQYIKLNGHLPGVPSSNVVKKDGIDAAKMSAIMLQKTEELTLYLIQLDERLRKLESKNFSDHD